MRAALRLERTKGEVEMQGTMRKARSVRTTILGGFLLLAMVLALLGINGMREQGKLNAVIEQLFEHNITTIETLGGLHRDTNQVRVVTLLSFTKGGGAAASEIRRAIEQELDPAIEDAMRALGRLQLTEAMRRTLRDLQEAWRTYKESRSITLQLAEAGDLEGAKENALSDAAAKYGRVTELLDELTRRFDEDGKVDEASAAELYAASHRITVGAIVVALAIALALGS